MKIAMVPPFAGAFLLIGCAPAEEMSRGEERAGVAAGADVGVATDGDVDLVGVTTLRDAGPGSGSLGAGQPMLKPPLRLRPAGTDPPSSCPTGSAVPAPVPTPVATRNPGLTGFEGINSLDQLLAGTHRYAGTQLPLEPSDNAVAVGHGRVLQAVNLALEVWDRKGNVIVPATALNQFFRVKPLFDPTTKRFGTFLSDPRTYFDADTDRWFISILSIELDPVTGAFVPPSHVRLAVSQSEDPAGAYFLYAIDVTNDCQAEAPCFGDQPLLGADDFGIYIDTNAFSLSTGDFEGTQIYALSKASLVAGTQGTVVRFGDIPVGCGEGSSIHPARPAPGSRAGDDTEYFMSSLNSAGVQNHIAVWRLTGTSSLDSGAPRLHLSRELVESEDYAQPPPALQKSGPRPLSLICDQGLLQQLDTGDVRMQQVMNAGGKLWSALTTGVGTQGASAGIAWFAVEPRHEHGHFRPSIFQQGYLAIAGSNSIIYPAVGVDADGDGAVAFTITGPRYFPSPGYARLDAEHGAGRVHLARESVGPEDGFTGYPGAPCDGTDGIARWGDYSAAAVDERGEVWMAMGDIPGPRTPLTNWGTFIAGLEPSGP